MADVREIRVLPLGAWLATPKRLRRGEVGAIVAHLPHSSAMPRSLDAEERRRMRRLAFADDRRRFAWSHAVLRAVLARYLDRPAAAVSFAWRANRTARPTLAPGARLRLGFSLSHSGEFAAVAVMRGAEIGIDVETARPGRDPLALARSQFAPSETAAIAARSGRERERIFLDFWTAKEAVLKALGVGLAHPLSDVVFGLDGDGRPRLREIIGGGFVPRRFAVRSLRLRSSLPSSLSIAAPQRIRSVILWTGDAAALVRAAERAQRFSRG